MKKVLVLLLLTACAARAGTGRTIGRWLARQVERDVREAQAKEEAKRRGYAEEVAKEFRARLKGYSWDDLGAIVETIDRYLKPEHRRGKWQNQAEEILQKLRYKELGWDDLANIREDIKDPAETRRLRQEIKRKGGIVEYIRSLAKAIWGAFGRYGRQRMRPGLPMGGVPVGL